MLLGLGWLSLLLRLESGLSLDRPTPHQNLNLTSTGQIHKAQEILSQLETLLRKKKAPGRNIIMELTNQFYSTIPHDFSKIKMNILDNLDVVLQKQDLCEELLQFH